MDSLNDLNRREVNTYMDAHPGDVKAFPFHDEGPYDTVMLEARDRRVRHVPVGELRRESEQHLAAGSYSWLLASDLSPLRVGQMDRTIVGVSYAGSLQAAIRSRFAVAVSDHDGVGGTRGGDERLVRRQRETRELVRKLLASGSSPNERAGRAPMPLDRRERAARWSHRPSWSLPLVVGRNAPEACSSERPGGCSLRPGA